MRATASKNRTLGFTLVELLVVISIIGLLVALLLPAVLGSREAARRGECANHLRNLAHAMTTYDTAKGRLPGYSQRLLRSQTQAVGPNRLTNPPRWALKSVELDQAMPISWATMLLPHIERQDVWDQILDTSLEPEIRPIALFYCPSDSGAVTSPDTPALTYSVNAGASDWDNGFLIDKNNPNIGDTIDNGIFLNLCEYTAAHLKAPLTRLGNIKDGASTTIMLTENIHKSYEPFGPGFPSRFAWAFGTEQHLAVVWVVANPPVPGDGYTNQERINYASEEVYDRDPVFDPNTPRFARPASSHTSGVNVAFCDGHLEFVRDNIEYSVYQRLLTANGKKCVDPRDHNAGVQPPNAGHPISQFRAAPMLGEKDYQ